jgi:hypothetical protein
MTNLNERIPLFEKDGFTICFEAQEEETSAHEYFIKECGWTEEDTEKVEDYPFFCAAVTAWKDGEERGAAYLGACSYFTIEEFYTKYKDDYFADMVEEALEEAKENEAKAAE